MSVELLGVNIDDFSFEESVGKALALIEKNENSQVITINPEMFSEAEKNPYFAKILKEAQMIIPDGVGVKIALKLKGHNVSRIPGIDFAYELLKRCAQKEIPVAIVGAKEEIIVKAINNLKAEMPKLNIVYYHNGYFNDDNQIYDEIKANSPKLVLVAMGSPRQEEFIYRAKELLPPALMVGIGGSLDVWSGEVKRAPEIYQKLCMEWLYRTISQPERFKRIFPALPLFLLKVLLHK